MLVATPMAVLPIPMTTWYRTTWTFWGWSSACVPWCCVWSGQPGWPFTVPASLSPTRNWTTIPSKSCRVLCFPSLQLSCLICKIRLPWLCPEQLEFNKALKPTSLTLLQNPNCWEYVRHKRAKRGFFPFFARLLKNYFWTVFQIF